MRKNSVLAEINELRNLQRGIPKGPHRVEIDERLQKLRYILSGMEANSKTIISKILFNNKPKANPSAKL